MVILEYKPNYEFVSFSKYIHIEIVKLVKPFILIYKVKIGVIVWIFHCNWNMCETITSRSDVILIDYVDFFTCLKIIEKIKGLFYYWEKATWLIKLIHDRTVSHIPFKLSVGNCFFLKNYNIKPEKKQTNDVLCL